MSAIAHAGLTVADLDRSLAFWRDAMGMVEVVSQEKQGGYLEAIVCEPGAHVRMVQLEFPSGGTRIELFQYLAPKGGAHRSRPADVGFIHVCVACNDIDAMKARLMSAGGVPLGPTVEIDTGVNAGGRGVYLRDPDGHVVELFTRPNAE